MSTTPFEIVVHRWGSRFVVTIEPRRVDKPSQVFRTAREALEFAERVSWCEGWPILNQLEAFDHGPRAA